MCGQKGKRKATLFIVLSRLSNKEDSVLQIEIVRPLHADRKYEFRAQLQISLFEQKYMGRLYLACVSISIMNSYCCTVVIPRFTTGRRFMQFHFCGNYLEKLGLLAVLLMMTALLLCTFSVLCLVPMMPPAFQETKVSLSPFDCFYVIIT